MIRLLLFSIVAFIQGLEAQSKCEFSKGEAVTASTTEGLVRGKLVDTESGIHTLVEQYLGIPYAKPPVGNLRFKDPQPLDTAGSTRDANTFGSPCVQFANGGLLGDEDCLHLNIWAPPKGTDVNTTKAVMVWFHGGSYRSQSTSLPDYDGRVLAGNGDVIVVTVNFRITVFGFIPLNIDGTQHVNQGLKDQQLALKWIQNNIHNFGGDRNKVTLFGQSSGGASAAFHMLAPSSKDLFQNAILQSANAIAFWTHNPLSSMRVYATRLANATNCLSGNNIDITCLQNASAQEILTAATTMQPLNPLGESLIWSPTPDGDFIPGEPLSLILNGQFSSKPLLLSVNQDEGTTLAVIPPLGPFHIVYAQILGLYQLTLQTPADINAAYPIEDPTSFNSTFETLATIFTDANFICPANIMANRFVQVNPKTYYAYLTYRSPAGPRPAEFGVSHEDSIQWVFGHPFLSIRDGYTVCEKLMSQTIMQMWSNFAKLGNPSTTTINYDSYGSGSYLEVAGPGRYFNRRNAPLKDEMCPLFYPTAYSNQ